MTFFDAVAVFAKSLPGTNAYVKLRQAMQQLIKDDVKHGAVYFLVFGFARAYVILYEDQEVSPAFAENNHKVLLSYLMVLQDALKQNEAEAIYNAMNFVVNEYENSKKVF